MDVKKIALLVGALIIAAVTAVMAKNMFTGASARYADGATWVRAERSRPCSMLRSTAFPHLR